MGEGTLLDSDGDVMGGDRGLIGGYAVRSVESHPTGCRGTRCPSRGGNPEQRQHRDDGGVSLAEEKPMLNLAME